MHNGATCPVKLVSPLMRRAGFERNVVAGNRKNLAPPEPPSLNEGGFVIYTRRDRAAFCLTPILSESYSERWTVE